jgi:hypothetical protein
MCWQRFDWKLSLVILRRAQAAGIPAIVDLLAADQL